jgi:hypothetical protein
MRFRYSCVGCSRLRELHHIIDNSRTITHDTFRKNVGKENYWEISSALGYDGAGGLTLSSDWSVSFHKSYLPDDRPVYYVAHSAIEYVFY